MMRRRIMVAGAIVLASTAMVGCGDGSSVGNGSQVMVVKMSNMSFHPASMAVHVGDTVTFRFVNDDTVTHEAVIGDANYQRRHAEMMAAMAGSSTTGSTTTGSTTSSTLPAEHGRSRAAAAHNGMNDPNAVQVLPGATGEVVFTFGKPTQLIIGCHEPGHYEAGMKAVIDVKE